MCTSWEQYWGGGVRKRDWRGKREPASWHKALSVGSLVSEKSGGTVVKTSVRKREVLIHHLDLFVLLQCKCLWFSGTFYIKAFIFRLCLFLVVFWVGEGWRKSKMDPAWNSVKFINSSNPLEERNWSQRWTSRHKPLAKIWGKNLDFLCFAEWAFEKPSVALKRQGYLGQLWITRPCYLCLS